MIAIVIKVLDVVSDLRALQESETIPERKRGIAIAITEAEKLLAWLKFVRDSK